MNLGENIIYLFILAFPIACIAWTVTHEQIFYEPRKYCFKKSKSCKSIWARKFFYLFTCEYCFSHYVTLFFLIILKYKLLYDDWRGYLIAFFALVWIANVYMSLFGWMRQELKSEKLTAEMLEDEVKEIKKEKENQD
ncbi:MAG: hypothetical protein Q4G27_05215 [Flavobacteriaceae bacterium]|nr:hypothetical protein [Flavobacteriaceae bacterium]